MKQDKENTFFTVCVPQIGVNDDSVTVTEYLFNEGDHVSKDEVLVVIESTKASIEVSAESSGYFLPCCEIGGEVGINGPLGYIFNSIEDLNKHKQSFNQNLFTDKKNTISELSKILIDNPSVSITKKAQALLKKHSIDINDINAETTIIRESDVLRHLSAIKETIPFPEFDSKKVQVVIYGCGHGARTVKETLLSAADYQVVGFIADRENPDTEIDNLPVLLYAEPEGLKRQGIFHIALAITDSVDRLMIFNRLINNNITVINAIHKKAYISPTAKVGAGNHIKAGALIDTLSTIGNACIVDNNVTIPHDNVIEDGVHLAPGVTLGSSITIGKNSIIGIGSSISTGITIGEYSIISVGSSVTTNVSSRSIVEGVPGKIIGTRKLHEK